MSTKRVSVPAGWLCCLKEESEYQQGGCDVYRKSLSTNRVAVLSTGRV